MVLHQNNTSGAKSSPVSKSDRFGDAKFPLQAEQKLVADTKPDSDIIFRSQQSAQKRINTIVSIRAVGNHTIHVKSALTNSQQGDPLDISKDLRDIGLATGQSFSSAEDAQLIHDRNTNLIPIEHPDSPRIGLQKEQRSISQFEVQSQINGDKGTVRIIDRLDPDGPIVLQKAFKLANRIDAVQEIQETLYIEMPKRHAAAQKLLQVAAARPQAEPGPVLLLKQHQRIPPQTLNSIKELLGQKGQMVLLVVPPEGNIDEAVNIRINGAALKTMGEKPIKINGQIIGIAIAREPQPSGTMKENSSQTIDKKGNVVAINVAANKAVATTQETIEIQPKLPIAGQSGGAAEIPCDLEFTTIDGTKINIAGMLTHDPIPERGTIGPYKLNSNLNTSQLKAHEAQIKDAAKGINKAERLFGLEPGQVITNLNIQDSKEYRAIVVPNDENVINLGDETLKESPHMLGMHEAIHSIDLAAAEKPGEVGLSSGRFQEQFENLRKESPAFLVEVSERKFFKGLASEKAGHAWENAPELLASFTNSLLHPKWEQKMQSTKPRFQEDYLKTIEAYQQSLKSRRTISKDAPIHTLLEQRKQQLERFRGD